MENPNTDEKQIIIEVKFFGVMDERFSKKAVFTVKTIDDGTDYTRYRSYSDFSHMRKQLLKKWVSFLIPGFPKMQTMVLKDYKEKYLEKKREYLNKFLQECLKNDQIRNSSDFYLFTKGPENYTENSKILKPDYREIYTRHSYFHKNVEESSADINSLLTYYDFFKTCAAELASLKKTLKKLHLKFESIQDSCLKFNSKLENIVSSYCSLEKPRNLLTFDPFINPYTSLYDWATSEKIQLASVLETFEKVFEVSRQDESLRSKIKERKGKIQSLEKGRQSISSLFDPRPPLEIITKETFSVNELENMNYCTKMLELMVSSEILNNIVPNFNLSKKQRYYASLLDFSAKALKCFDLPH